PSKGAWRACSCPISCISQNHYHTQCSFRQNRFRSVREIEVNKATEAEYGLMGLHCRRPPMQIAKMSACAVLICVAIQAQSQTPKSDRRVVIAASRILDGRGHILKNTRIVIEGTKIVAIDPKAAPIDYDLLELTVLPGWIDAHAHITWSFGPDGKNAGAGETTQDAAYRAAANA